MWLMDFLVLQKQNSLKNTTILHYSCYFNNIICTGLTETNKCPKHTKYCFWKNRNKKRKKKKWDLSPTTHFTFHITIITLFPLSSRDSWNVLSIQTNLKASKITLELSVFVTTWTLQCLNQSKQQTIMIRPSIRRLVEGQITFICIW
jgi:hypothetical protein